MTTGVPEDVPFGETPVPASETKLRVHPADEEYVPPVSAARVSAVTDFPSRNGNHPIGRSLPHSIEAEEYLLSCCLIDGADVLARCDEAHIRPESFYVEAHVIIFRHLQRMHKAKQPIDVGPLAEELKAERQLDAVGGYAFLMQVSGGGMNGHSVATIAQAGYYIDKVRERALLRETIRAATRSVEDAYNFSGGIDEFLAEQQARLKAVGAGGNNSKAPTIIPRGICSFAVPPDEDSNVLLGHRYLNRGDGMVMVSSSGMGKSSMCLQAAVTWAFGKPFLGIKPNGILRSLIIQSEDGDGDIGEVWASICYKMGLTDADKATAGERVVVVTDRVNRGPAFLAELKRQIHAGKYDLVWINPLAAFISGDATTAETAGEFLRGGLNALNEPPSFGYIIIQHTTKPATGKDRSERRWHEVMYDMAGSYDIIGWARAIISLRPTEQVGEFNLVLAKRGRRAGVTKRVPQGTGYRMESSIIVPVKHCDEKMVIPELNREIPVIFWEDREEEESQNTAAKSNGRPKKHDFETFRAIFPAEKNLAVGINELLRSALQIKPIAKGSLYAVIADAQSSGLVSVDTSDPRAALYYLKPQKGSA